MKKIVFSLLLIMLGNALLALAGMQDGEQVLLRVGEREVTLSEFEAVYHKNNVAMEVADPKSVNEYLELYINFNLKVLEAMSLGMDTNPQFLAELKTYRDQLSRPYFNDKEVAEHIIEEAYARMQYDLRVSHILIRVAQDALPSDTLNAYNRINDLRSRVMAGESFSELAITYSEDAAVRDIPGEPGRPVRKGNEGDLGYFTVFNMIYPFETAAYNTPVGQVSMPVRSDFGYHILYVVDKLPAMGTARVAHIMLLTNPEQNKEQQEEVQERIMALYDRILAGEDFGELAREYSEDHNTASRGGALQPFVSGRMAPEFIATLSKMGQDGEISKPFQTSFGWHIVKLIERTLPGSFEEEYEGIRTRVSRDVRSQLSKQVVLERLKREYSVQEFRDRLEPFFTIVDESIFSAAWSLENPEKLSETLLKIADESFTQNDFATFLVERQAHRSPQEMSSYINNMFTAYVEHALLAYEDSMLEEKYPEFGRLMQEYHDGILLFELTDQKVWTKALADTAGQEAFYKANIHRYMTDAVMDATVFVFSSEADALAANEILKQALIGENSDTVVKQQLAANGINTSVTRRQVLQGEHPAIDELIWSVGLRSPVRSGDGYMIVQVHEVTPPAPRKMNEIKGLLISDYQQYLEEQWVKELRGRYDIFIDRTALQQIQHFSEN